MTRPPLSHYLFALVPPLANAGLHVAAGVFVACCWPAVATLALCIWLDERTGQR